MNDLRPLLFSIFTSLVFTFTFSSIQAATIYAVNDGPWAKEIWSDPAGPQPGDSIVIPAGITVHLNTFVDLSTPANNTNTRIEVFGKLLFYNRSYHCETCDEVAIKVDSPSYLFFHQEDGLEEFDEGYTHKQNIYFGAAPATFSLPFGPGRISAVGAVLPVTLIQFSAVAATRANQLSWTTASEVQSSHFVVQAAYDDQSFVDIGIVTAQGNYSGISTYQFEETNDRTKTYYRLKIVDMDGSYDFSPIVVVERQASAFELEVFPNPFVEDLNVKLSLNKYNFVQIQIFAADGTLVRQDAQHLSAGQHTLTYHLNANQNNYFIRVKKGNQSSTKQISALPRK